MEIVAVGVHALHELTLARVEDDYIPSDGLLVTHEIEKVAGRSA